MEHTQIGSARGCAINGTPMTFAGLEYMKGLWRELQRTSPTSDRYQELVALIRAEISAHPTPTDMDQGLEPRPDRPSALSAKAVVNDADLLRAR
jgi:hypothetical protein